jgi:hypothetical protein
MIEYMQSGNRELTYVEGLLDATLWGLFSDFFSSSPHSNALRWTSLLPLYRWGVNKACRVKHVQGILRRHQMDTEAILKELPLAIAETH